MIGDFENSPPFTKLMNFEKKSRHSFLLAVALLAMALHAFADNGTWTSTSSAAWNTTSPWSGGNIADGSGFTANFSTINPTSDVSVTLGADRTIGNLTFGDTDTSTAAGWTVTGSALNLAGGTPTVTVNALGTGKKATIDSVIGGGQGLAKAGTGTLVLGAANHFSGGSTLLAGTVITQNNTSFAAGSVTLSGGTWDDNHVTHTYTNSLVMATGTSSTILTGGSGGGFSLHKGAASGSGNVTFGATGGNQRIDGNWAAFTGTVTIASSGGFYINAAQSTTATAAYILSTPTNLPNDGNTCNFGSLSGSGNLATGSTAGKIVSIGALNSDTGYSGNISGGGALIKVGTGILTLTGANNHTGGTTITSGTLCLGNGTSSNGTLTGPVTNNATFMVANPSDQTLSSDISGSGGLVKSGAGTLTLNGNNTYTSATTITNGTLRLTANQSQIPAGLKIMPLGDSITYGGGNPATNAGYRGYLHPLLAPIAPGFQFIGVSNGNAANLPTTPLDQTHHNGYSSYASLHLTNNLDGLDTEVLTRYNSSPQGGYWLVGGNDTGRDPAYPDVILLQVGANDIAWGNNQFNPQISTANYQANLTSLLNKLTTLRPDARVIVAKITPWSAQAANVTTVNNAVVTVVANFQAQGKHVGSVDLHTGFPAGGMSPDGVHPNDTGYAWMAGQWRDAIVATVGTPSAGTTTLPSATNVSVAAGATLDLNHTEAAIAGLDVSGAIMLGSGKLSTAASASFAAGSAFATRINRDTASVGRLAVTGNLTLGNATLSLASTGSAALKPDTKFTLATYTGTLNGTFNSLPEGSILTVAGTPFILRYADGGKNITLTVITPYQSWISTEHPALAGDDSQPTADPDDDGLANLIEYALGLDPQVTSPNPVQFDKETIGADTYLSLSVARDPAGSNVVIKGERSVNLASGTWSTVGVVEESTSTHFRIRDSQPISSASRSFLRLRFTQP
jgi:autotransporter-associated beta strand protein